MPLTRLQLKNRIKSTRGLTRDREDGLLTDELIHEAINEAIIQVGIDCHILPTTYSFSLVADQYKYPMPEDMFEMRSIFYIDSNGNRQPVTNIDQESFLAGRDPADDTNQQPLVAAYPIYSKRRLEIYGKAQPLHDYVQVSHVTTKKARVLVDTGVNFGRTKSGIRISPGDLVRNNTNKAFGYVQVLETITNKISFTATTGTSATQVVSPTSLAAAGIKKDDLIVTPNSGLCTTYGFVTELSGSNTLLLEDIRGEASAFASGDTIRVGVAQRVFISMDAPHRGLREGSDCIFNVGSATATMNGTTFTDTRCTGSSPSGASVTEIAIASGGSHGKITAVGSNYIDVEEWIGGNPSAGEVVTIQECDEYQIETRPEIEPIMWLRPTPNTSDAQGERSIVVNYVKRPFLPTQDWQFVDVPDRYRQPLYRCVEWQCIELSGNKEINEKQAYETAYRVAVERYRGDIDRGPKGEIQTVMSNRNVIIPDKKWTTRSGIHYDMSAIEE